MILLILAIFSFILFLYNYFKNSYSYWEKKEIFAIKPRFIFGNFTNVIFQKTPLCLIHKELYNKFAPHEVAGFYVGSKPILMFRDPELIKNILVKDFHYFYNRGIPVHPKIEPLSNHLFSLQDEEWRNLRIKLSNTFTSGKMKMMFPLVKECAEELNCVVTQAGKTETTFEAKDLFARFTTDVIGSCAFGIRMSCLKDSNSKFHEMGKRIFKFRFGLLIRGLFPNVYPSLIKIFKLNFLEPEVVEFFISLVSETVHYREKNYIKRNDFLDSLIALKNNTESEKIKHHDDKNELENMISDINGKQFKSNIQMTSDLMAAQSVIFFTAGFETTSSTLNYIIFEMTQHPDIQKKMREEILNMLNKYNNELSYDVLKELTYMDMVIAESLRKYPPATFAQRICTENYKIPNTKTTIQKGTLVIIPIYGIHSDKKYYEYPDEFYPEHFTEDAISKRPQFTYLPFGGGPRICIAERFAKMEIKVALTYLLKNHEFYLSPKTKLPLKFISVFGLLSVKDGIWITCKNI